jgi:electron transport complex protein RnfC
MIVGVTLEKNKKMSIKNSILEFKKPNYVYIPLVNHTNLDCKPLVNVGDQVYKGSVIGLRNDKLTLPIHSSVSGKVIGIEEHPYLNGKNVKCVVIENDFKEKVENKSSARKDISNYTKEEFIAILKNCGVVGMGGSGFPTYVKYDTQEPINTLIVNGVECEPYITADFILMREKAEEILECIDAILEITGASKGIIAIIVDNPDLKEAFNKYLGTYPNISLVEVEDMYPMGWERNLIKYVLNTEYDRYPIEKGIVINNVSTIYAIYEALKYNKPVIEKLITITGEDIKKPQNILVKIGTKAADVIEFVGGVKKVKDLKLIAGGPMMGVSAQSDDLVISNNLNCLLIMRNKNNDPYINCMRCGKCVQVCPAKISPVLIKNALNNKDQLEYLQPKKCIECGLCSYICPSKVDVREYVRKAKEIVGEK